MLKLSLSLFYVLFIIFGLGEKQKPAPLLTGTTTINQTFSSKVIAPDELVITNFAGPDVTPSPACLAAAATGELTPATEAPRDESVVPPDPAARAAFVDDVHWEAMMAVAGARVEGPAGQLPVVFDDPFPMLDADECVEVLARLVRLTDNVQMVVVTDRPEVAEWAEAIGPDHAAVLEVAT